MPESCVPQQTKQVPNDIHASPDSYNILYVVTDREFCLMLRYLKLNISSVLVENHTVDIAAFSTQSAPLFLPYGDE